ncbi:MAG: VapC toxin family PIN domain ribonuclease [Chloroflexi bacterium]|nr:VapC toxin family PIN domain ribonuclease [Chloroflexota bacterium]
MAILIDTNFLVALAAPKDNNHIKARQFLPQIRKEKLLVPSPVLQELFYMLTNRLDYNRAVQNFAQTQVTFPIQDLVELDLYRMSQIMAQYSSSQFDFVDVSIMALAERLNIQKICTFDRRDFSIFKPTHCTHLEVLPN